MGLSGEDGNLEKSMLMGVRESRSKLAPAKGTAHVPGPARGYVRADEEDDDDVVVTPLFNATVTYVLCVSACILLFPASEWSE